MAADSAGDLPYCSGQGATLTVGGLTISKKLHNFSSISRGDNGDENENNRNLWQQRSRCLENIADHGSPGSFSHSESYFFFCTEGRNRISPLCAGVCNDGSCLRHPASLVDLRLRWCSLTLKTLQCEAMFTVQEVPGRRQ